MIPQDKIDSIFSAANLTDVISDFLALHKSGSSYYTACPSCGREGKNKGLIVTPSKSIYKCFSCDFGGNSAVNFLMDTQNMSYPDALKWLANKYAISIQEEPAPKGPQRKEKVKVQTFRDKQLAQSGLEDVDQKVTTPVDEHTSKVVDSFESGTKDQYGRIVPGDDMIIWYYDLDGKPEMYIKPKSSKPEHLFRIRWQNPDLHHDQHGKAMKYSSPYGSGSHLFIPELVRKIYKDRRVIKRLYIQEGEKKAIKASKHGLPSVGIMGIQNIGSQGKLPYSLQLIVQACQVEEVVFVLDNDWNHLSNSLKPGQKVDQRPFSFYYAVKNFRDYFKTFVNMGIYLEIYFAYIQNNEKGDKGIDDLLANTLAGRENDLYQDVNQAINEKDGAGRFMQLHKISTVSDLKLLEFWNLQNAEVFATYYKDELAILQEFMIGKHLWRFNEHGKVEPAQPLQEEEQFWEITRKTDRFGNEHTSFRFCYLYAYNFLKWRGFGRILMANRKFEFCHVKNKTVSIVEPYQIRDYMTEFVKGFLPKDTMKEVIDMLYRGGKMYYGPDSLSNIDFIQPVFERAEKGYQYLYFKEKYWKITANGIEEKPMSELMNYIWSDQIINFDAKLLQPLVQVEKIDSEIIGEDVSHQMVNTYLGQYAIDFSPESEHSHFIRFLWNTSEFYWHKLIDPETRKPLHDTRSMEEKFHTHLHFLAKMTAIGYLLHDFRDKSCEKAVIAMDGKMSEVGDSNGRSGKSLLGYALGHLIPQVYIGGKSRDLTEDPFIFEEVNEKSKNIFIDDVRANVDFEFFFPVITGKITINCKGVGKFTLPEKQTPKMYLTTNHAINGSTSSFLDRQALIAFSDFYSDIHKPIDDFGYNFFDEWDENQWNLFYNFMGSCLVLYFKAQQKGWGINQSGLITPPMDRIEMRRLRQECGEVFIAWADEYYGLSDDEDVDEVFSINLNKANPRSEMYQDFLEKNPVQRKFYTSNAFMKRLIAYCRLRNLKINPHIRIMDNGRPGYDKRGGVEYITVANERWVTSDSF